MIYKSFLLGLAQAFAFTFLLSACGEQPSTTERRELQARELGEDFVQSSCAYTFEDGDNVPSSLPSPRWVNAPFQKPYNEANIAAVLPASASAVYGFIQQDGVSVYRVPAAGRACKMLGSLPKAPKEYLDFWFSYDTSGHLLGLFLPIEFFRVGTKSVILLREDTDRYSLLHEYFHHVFNQARKLRGMKNDLDVQNHYSQVRERYQRERLRWDRASTESTERMARAWLDHVDAYVDFVKRYYLEEMAIESRMTDYYYAMQLPRVTAFNRSNSPDYVTSSWGKARDELSNHIKSGVEVFGTMPETSDLRAQVRAKALELDGLFKEAESVNLKYGRSTTMNMISTGDGHGHGPMPCSRTIEADHYFRREAR